jgi:hypothetical protein
MKLYVQIRMYRRVEQALPGMRGSVPVEGERRKVVGR